MKDLFGDEVPNTYSPQLPFGRYRGHRLTSVPTGYLAWFHREGKLTRWLRQHVAEELRRREEQHSSRMADLDGRLDLCAAEPRVVHGVDLVATEAAIFAEAVDRGELVIGVDMPLSSPVPEAWRRWCAAEGRPHRVREVK